MDDRYCACGKKLGCKARGKFANQGFVRRKGHDQCNRCYKAVRDRERAFAFARERALADPPRGDA